MMYSLPPVDLSTARGNPKFVSLYNSLSTSSLNPDGSAKLSSDDARRQASIQTVHVFRFLARESVQLTEEVF